MEDREILDLYWHRMESAIAATNEKYHPYCFHIAASILGNSQDAEECVNDTWLKAWNSIPPNRPANMATYLGKLVRTTAIDCLRKKSRKQRGGTGADVVLDELAECIPDIENIERKIEEQELTELLNLFLGTLSRFDRNVFVCRYWYFESVKAIAKAAHAKESRIKSILFRTRKKLKSYLEEEGYYVGK